MSQTKRKTSSKLESVAYHEAGHTVAAYEMNCRFKYVTIIPQEDSLGRCRLTFYKQFRPDIHNDSKTRTYTEKAIICLLGGITAEKKFTGRLNRNGAYKDLSTAMQLVASHVGNEKEMHAYYNWLWIRTENFWEMDYLWASVKELAVTLLKEQKISYQRARRIIAEASNTSMSSDL
jgi:ATP-dependent Zn protease